MSSVGPDFWDLTGQGERDRTRYQKKVEESLKKHLDNIITHENIITAPDGKRVRIQIPDIHEPRFRPWVPKSDGIPRGLGSGDGGDPIARYPQPKGGGDPDGAGNEHAEGTIGLEVPLEQVAAWVFEELNLPLLQPKGGSAEEENAKFTARGRKGVVLDRKRTLLNHLRREQAAGEKQPWIESELIYRRWHEHHDPMIQAVVVLVRDASGSIDAEMQFCIRVAYFWTVLWLRHNYPHVEVRFVLHDTDAMEVTEEQFFETLTMGGTFISSGLLKAEEILENYPADRWNRYVLFASDGDNFPSDAPVVKSVIERLSNSIELLGYMQLTLRESDVLRHMQPGENRRAAVVSQRSEVAAFLRAMFGSQEKTA